VRPLAPFLALAYGSPRRSPPDFAPKKILVIRRNGIGDMICALPLLRHLQRAFPAARIDVLASARNAPILEGVPLVSRVLVYQRGRGLMRNHYFNLRRLLSPVREERYDLALAANGSFSRLVAVIAYATGIPRRLGFVPRAGHALDFCFDLPVPQPERREHQIERCLRLLEPLGVARGDIDLGFALGAEHEAYADATLRDLALEPRGFMLYAASASRPASAWPPASIAALAAGLERRHALRTLVCGLRQDRALMQATSLPFVETPSVRHFAALVRRARFLTCGDGGPMHVAAAMGTPAFVLFSSTTDPQVWKPWGVRCSYLQARSAVAGITAADALVKIDEWLKEDWSG
jgi:heptosyltransferase III